MYIFTTIEFATPYFKFQELFCSVPQNNCEFTMHSMTRVKNSLIGSPKSTATSAVPTSSVNLMDTLFSGENIFLLRPLKAPSQI